MVSNTFPGLAFFHCDEAPERTQPAVIELIEHRPKPEERSCDRRRPKYVLPIPGSPSRSIGGNSRQSLDEAHSAMCFLTSSRTSAKLGSSSYRLSIAGIPEGFTVRRAPPPLILFLYGDFSGSFAAAGRLFNARSPSPPSQTSLNTP